MQYKNLTDIHCHLIPYVDDGAQTLLSSKNMIWEQINQGVTTIYCTPHYRSKMFETSDDEVHSQFARLVDLTRLIPNAPILKLSREYYCSKEFLNLIHNKRVIPLTINNHLLVEFSLTQSKEEIMYYVKEIIHYGYKPIISHIERYENIRDKKLICIRDLIKMGALMQINTGSILGLEGLSKKRFSRKLLKENLVYLVASDSHDATYRKPNLHDCAKRMRKYITQSQFNLLFYQNPKDLERAEISIGEKEYETT